MGFTDEEILQQEAILGDRYDFVSALREFFETLFKPSYESESPYSIVLNVHELYPGEVENAHELLYLNSRNTWRMKLRSG